METRKTRLPTIRGPLVERASAIAAELEQREKRAVWVSGAYLSGLIIAPLAAIYAVGHTLGNVLGLPILALLILAITQKMSAPTPVAGQRESGDHDDGMVPLTELGQALEATLERLATRVGAPLPEVVYLAPEQFAAGWIPTFHWDYVTWRVDWTPALVLGVLPMRAMGRDELEAVLAHELAHLSRRPGLSAALFSITQLAAEAFVQRARQSTFQALCNPACWWTRFFFRALDHTVIASGRLEELRADEVAVRAVGAEALASALDTYILTLARVRALAAQHIDSATELRTALHSYFEHGTSQLPSERDPEVQSRRRRLSCTRGASHPTESARRFMASQVKDPGATLPDASDEGTLYLLPRAGRAYLPTLVRYVVAARRTLALRSADADQPWSVCHDQRARMPRSSGDGWLPRWEPETASPAGPPSPHTRPFAFEEISPTIH